MNSDRPAGIGASQTDAALENGIQAYAAGDLQTAKSVCEAILSTEENHSGANHLLSAIYLRNGSLEQAAAAAQRAVSTNPEDASFRNGLALVYHALGKFEEAGHGNWMQA